MEELSFTFGSLSPPSPKNSALAIRSHLNPSSSPSTPFFCSGWIQDLGNTNYSILIPKDMFERRPNAELVARALNTLGVDAKVNDRNDITLDGFKMSPRFSRPQHLSL